MSATPTPPLFSKIGFPIFPTPPLKNRDMLKGFKHLNKDRL